MKNKIECPFCDGIAELIIKKEKKTFRKEDFEIFAHYYRCSKCKEEFTTTQLDDLNVKQVYNSYREKHNIPLAGQMKYLRERYGISAAKMSKILGLGPNQYGLYEKGDIPNESNSQLIDVISEPKSFKRQLIKRKPLLTGNEFAKTLSNIDALIAMDEEKCSRAETIYFNPLGGATEMNGYQMPSFKKFANMVIYYLRTVSFATRLNKYLFYADFENFKNTGTSITGCNYAAIDLGPVPHEFKSIYDILEEQGYISTEPYYAGTEVYEKFVPNKNFDETLFTNAELESMSEVEKRFKNLNTRQVVDLSHEEIGWLENKDKKSLISYQKYGFALKAL